MGDTVIVHAADICQTHEKAGSIKAYLVFK